MKVSVSFLTSTNIKDDLINLAKTDTDYIHVDVMDGLFVPKVNEPYPDLKDLQLDKKLDVHLMVQNPLAYIEKYSKLNTEYITIHHEIDEDTENLLNIIKSNKIKCGISINPDTDVDVLKKYLYIVDQILIMSVVPGKGGQAFIEDTVGRIEKVRNMIQEVNRDIVINVDGGINSETIKKVRASDIVVSGNFILSSADYQERIDLLR